VSPSAHRAETLSAAEMQALSAHAVTRTFPKSTVIISEGDPAESLYIIVSGRVKCSWPTPEGGRLCCSRRDPASTSAK